MNQVTIQEKLTTKKTCFKSVDDFHIQTSLLEKKGTKSVKKIVSQNIIGEIKAVRKILIFQRNNLYL